MCSCETVAMGKSACIKKLVAVRNYSTDTIMEKKTEGERDGGWLRIWHFHG